ncbi:acylphosphatase [Xanthomonas citri pv. citri]|uniref:Acylphosphatase n=5 Tax=Xanthomonas TaxID=338 RepID=ACYP_XANAC|nr:RecName: Full=Acylphosphatase; AltName: Full=Acylphosphate phosphohydrolase [Xanthomonas citri pv. citri str. 306]AGH76477.1 acylphosphatase [Xanthomonas axonopodis Xac29-1]AGI09408.1 acylphosphatase [Xanthomonas citri subsp. citri Aw12879]AJD67531.1 acylphosphatase [Xanthomonas citri subsp. citri A306]AJY81065.1 Acylphosphatase [Xanthomonas citri pv. citri]AJY85487.1 Acylphosphatase [Xanthomonas citri subsp. citri UI6]OOW82464.1 acylphosphatase [Xanthomonas axonopodis pv. clitoriae]QOX03
MQAARFVVSGVVQGVYYRACTRQRAVALGLVGHARNQADGSVDVVAAGSAAALDALEAWLCRARRPPRSRRSRARPARFRRLKTL